MELSAADATREGFRFTADVQSLSRNRRHPCTTLTTLATLVGGLWPSGFGWARLRAGRGARGDQCHGRSAGRRFVSPDHRPMGHHDFAPVGWRPPNSPNPPTRLAQPRPLAPGIAPRPDKVGNRAHKKQAIGGHGRFDKTNLSLAPGGADNKKANKLSEDRGSASRPALRDRHHYSQACACQALLPRTARRVISDKHPAKSKGRFASAPQAPQYPPRSDRTINAVPEPSMRAPRAHPGNPPPST
ncbi:hypothetical protein PG985_013027 [Apiospora marii]|uniref:Uncharacterized protein n=1 Tax=Apiospora marii TaxID=335849 RepID=A0ABR1R8P6_9PEZI